MSISKALTPPSGLNLTNLHDDVLISLLGQYCDLPSVAALSATCRRFSELLLQNKVWKAHLFHLLSVHGIELLNPQLLGDARALLVSAKLIPLFPTSLQNDNSFRSIRHENIGSGQLQHLPSASFDETAYHKEIVRANAPFCLTDSSRHLIKGARTVVRAQGHLALDNYRTILKFSRVSYFEVHLHPQNDNSSSRSVGYYAIGLSTSEFPGVSCIMYHSENGNVKYPKRRVAPFGPTYSNGDVVGCGIHIPTGAIFFTLNGNFIATAALQDKQKGDELLYPTIEVGGKASFSVNFGNRVPFRFDPESVTALYDTTQSDLQLPEDFTCVYSQASHLHPWSVGAVMDKICLNDDEYYYDEGEEEDVIEDFDDEGGEEIDIEEKKL